MSGGKRTIHQLPVPPNYGRHINPANNWQLPQAPPPIHQQPTAPPPPEEELEDDDLDNYYDTREAIQQHYYATTGIRREAEEEDVLHTNYRRKKAGHAPGTKSRNVSRWERFLPTVFFFGKTGVRPAIDTKLMKQSRELIARDEIYEDTVDEREALLKKHPVGPQDIVNFKEQVQVSLGKRRERIQNDTRYQAVASVMRNGQRQEETQIVLPPSAHLKSTEEDRLKELQSNQSRF